MNFSNEQTKTRVLLAIGLVGLLALGGLVISNVNKSNQKNEDAFIDNVIGISDFKHLLTANKDGEIKLLNPKDGDLINEIDFSDSTDIIYKRSDDLSKLLAYDKTSKTFTLIETKGDNINTSDIYTLREAKEIKEFKFNDRFIVLSGENELTYIDIENNTLTEITSPGLKDFVVQGDKLIFAVPNNVHLYDLTINEAINSVNIDSEVSSIQNIKNNVVVYSDFGNGLRKSTIFNMDTKELYIDSAYTEETISPITIDTHSSLNTASFVEVGENNVYHISVNTNDGRRNKSNISSIVSNAKEGFVFNEDSTLSYENFVVSLVEDRLVIYNTTSNFTEESHEVHADYFTVIIDNGDEVVYEDVVGEDLIDGVVFDDENINNDIDEDDNDN
ncbi:MAG: hypothetical protein R3Y64_11350 [Peptostreptococcaceae bacterium]